MEIVQGIHSIEGIRQSNCYIIIRPDKLLLIDTGMPGNTVKITDYIKNLNKNPSEIKYIILTHADIDHIGSSMELKAITGAKLAIHADDAPVLAGKERLRGRKGFIVTVLSLASRLVRSQAEEPEIVLQNDSEIEGFKIVHTPGHTSGSICIYHPNKILFTGDTVLSDSKGNPRPPTYRMLSNRSYAWNSLVKIAELDYDILLPGHGAPVIGKASWRVRKMVDLLGSVDFQTAW